MHEHDPHNPTDRLSRLLLKLAWETAARGPFESIADFGDEFKTKVASLKLRGWTTLQLDRAIMTVVHADRLTLPPLPRKPSVDRLVSEPPILSKAEAVACLARLGMPSIKSPTPSRGRIIIDGPVPRDEVDHDRY